MELVKAYVKLGFKSVKSIQPQDVDRIVDRYLAGDDMETIAREEARRIRNEFHASGPELTKPHPLTGEPYDNDDDTEESEITKGLSRPIPRDMSFPDSPPPPPKPKLTFRYEGQRDDDTHEEHLARMSYQRWKFLFMASCLLILGINISVAICNAGGVEIGFPIGFIPFPFIVLTWWMWKKKHHKLQVMKAERRTNEMIERLREDSQEGSPVDRPDTEPMWM